MAIDDTTKPPKTDDQLVSKVRRCFDFAVTNEEKQRQREIEDLKFAALDQWPDDAKRSRAGNPNPTDGTPALPPRPCMVMDMLGPMLRQITNQQRQARMAVEVTPKSEGTRQEDAELLQGMIRQIEYDSTAQVPRSAAFARAVKCGRGYYRVLTKYANDGDFDLDISIEAPLNQGSVYLDPTHEQPDGSDANWAIIVSSLTWEDYCAEFHDSKLATDNANEEDLRALGDHADGWVTGEGEFRKVRVAEYYYVHTEKKPKYQLEDGTITDQLPDGAKAVNERQIESRSVKWAKVNGVEVLEQEDWPGRYIPIIQVVGEEVIVPDDEDMRRYYGIIRPARDPQLGLNVMISAEVEAIGLAPKSPFIAYVETIEGFESWWNQANTRNFPYLPLKATRGGDGRPLPEPKRSTADVDVQAIAHSIVTFRESVKAATGLFDPSLGNLSANERSGRAILALQRQADVGSSNYLDNLARAITYEGKILTDLIPHIYNRPGRIMRIIRGNDESSTVMLNQPFVEGPNGQPQPVQEGTPNAKNYQLTPDAQFSVVCKVGKAFDTAREETADRLSEVLGNAPQLTPMFLDILFSLLNQPELSKRAKLILPPQIQQAESGNQPSVELLQQQLQQVQEQAKQMIDALSKELQAKTQIIETDEIKANKEIELASLKANTDAQIRLTELASEERMKYRELEVKSEIELAKIGSAQSMKRGELEQQELHQHNEILLARETREADDAQAELDRQSEREAVNDQPPA